MVETQKLLREYATNRCENSFGEIVNHYVNLVYSAALRLVNGDSHRAEDVTQKVFADLAKQARDLPEEVALGGWLHRHTCFVARNAMRGDRRRRRREQQAMEIHSMEDHDAVNLSSITPVLDEAINELGPEEQQAIMLRYFEQQEFRAVGEGLGSTEEAARKRVNRALEKLQQILKRRGVVLSTSALGSFLGSQAVIAAPAGLAAAATAAALTGAAVSSGATAGFLQFMSMTKAQTGILAAVTLALAIPLGLQYQAAARLKEENQALRRQTSELQKLAEENQRLSNRLAAATKPPAAPNSEQFNELMRLRGEVGVLRKALNEIPAAEPASGAESVLSGITANPEMHKMIRDQQKLGLSMIYQGLGKQANLPEEKIKELNELLADNVMTNIDHITMVLQEGKTPEEMDPIFAAQEAKLEQQVKELLGPEGFAAYEDYTQNIASYLTSQQFKSMMTGENEEKNQKSKELFELMKEETKLALQAAGLPPDYQTVPTLNFRNIASEAIAEKNLNLLDSIYGNVAARAGSFLNEKDLEKFAEFRKIAIDNNKIALTVNRKVMAPSSAGK